MNFNKARGISRMSPDPLLVGGVCGHKTSHGVGHNDGVEAMLVSCPDPTTEWGGVVQCSDSPENWKRVWCSKATFLNCHMG